MPKDNDKNKNNNTTGFTFEDATMFDMGVNVDEANKIKNMDKLIRR